MRKGFLLATVSLSLVLCGCNQAANDVPVYKYGGGRESGAGSLGIHTLRSGETLWSVANAYHVDLRDMLDLNRLRAPYRLQSGQRLKIPAPLTYQVHRGDTLYKVSRMFDSTTTELARLNNMRAPYSLNANQVIRLPSKHANLAPAIKSAPASISVPDYSVPTVAPVQREALPPSRQVDVAAKSTGVVTSKVVPSSAPSVVPAETVVADTSRLPLVRSGKGFLKPVGGKVISGYGVKSDGLHNDGINIKATRGDPVRAAEQGVVVYNGSQIEGYGNMLLIRHADGFMTAYAHMDKTLVKKGERVKRGQTVGTVGSTGHVDTPQLHFEIRKGKDAVDPSPYIRT